MSPAFAADLVRHRLAVPISQEDAAALIGVTLAAMCNWERLHSSSALYPAARAAALLGIDAELRSYARHTDGPVLRREDLRDQNAGVNGLYHRRPKPVRLKKADALAACQSFADRVADAQAELGIDDETLIELAEISPRQFAKLVRPKDPRQCGLVLCATVARVLGLPDKLAAFAGPGVSPIARSRG